MTNKAPFCAFLWLTLTVLGRLKIKVRPKGLHNFAFYILIFAFSFQSLTPNPSSLIPAQPLISLHASTYVPVRHLYNCRDTFTYVMSALQIRLFMQNKAKFKKVKSNVTDLLIRNYEQMDTWSIRKKQSQYKANTNPIQTQTNPISEPKSCRRLY